MAEVQILAEGLHFGEGPRWHHGKLWFSDFYDHEIKTVDSTGSIESMFVVDGQPSGLGWLPDGRLLVVSMLDRRLLRQEYQQLVVHADLSPIVDFPCNDMVVDVGGRAYVGNYGFDLDAAMANGTLDEVVTTHAGTTLIRVDPDGTVHRAAEGLQFPNGAVISADGRTLIVAETMGRRLTAFDRDADGSLHRRRTWASLGRRMPDGICLDATGSVWVANARANECISVSSSGAIAEVIETSQPCFACMLGGDDGRTLFMLTAASSDARVACATRTGRIETCRVAVPGAGRP